MFLVGIIQYLLSLIITCLGKLVLLPPKKDVVQLPNLNA
jgi:hypothetical protein